MLRYPTFGGDRLFASERKLVRRLAGAPTTPETIRSLGEGWWKKSPDVGPWRECFRDELGEYLPSPVDWSAEELIEKAIGELVLTLPLYAASPHSSSLQLNLEELHSSVSGRDEPLRQRPVCVSPDRMGNSVLFPPPERVPILLEEMFAFLATIEEQAPILAATACYVGLMHAHPFDDGNGRLGRALFNLVLNRGETSFHYVPVQLLYHDRQGDFLIKLRRAMYGSDWGGIYSLFTAAVRVSLYFHPNSGA